MIAKLQGASNKIDPNVKMTMSTTQQSFFYCHIARSDHNKTANAREEQIQLPCNNQIFMLLFAGCNNNHVMPRDDQRCKYTKVEYGKITKEAVFIEEGDNKTLAKEGDNKSLDCQGWQLGWVQ